MPQKFARLTKPQWEALFHADTHKGVTTLDYSQKLLDKLTKPVNFNSESVVLLTNAKTGVYRLTEDGQMHVNLKKMADAHTSALEQKFMDYWAFYGDSRYLMTRQAKLIPERQFAFDFAFLEQRVLVEIQGGIGNNGAHVRIGQYNKDCEKLLLGQLEGYQVFWLTGQMLRNDTIAGEYMGYILRALDNAT